MVSSAEWHSISPDRDLRTTSPVVVHVVQVRSTPSPPAIQKVLIRLRREGVSLGGIVEHEGDVSVDMVASRLQHLLTQMPYDTLLLAADLLPGAPQ